MIGNATQGVFLMLEGEATKESEAIMENAARVLLNDVIGMGHWMAGNGMVKIHWKVGESWRESRHFVSRAGPGGWDSCWFG